MKEERPTSIANDTLVTLPRIGLCSGNLLKCTSRGVAEVRHNHQMFGLMEDIVWCMLFMLFYLHHPISNEKKKHGSLWNHEQQKAFLLLFYAAVLVPGMLCLVGVKRCWNGCVAEIPKCANGKT